jgi:hypothetical protein
MKSPGTPNRFDAMDLGKRRIIQPENVIRLKFRTLRRLATSALIADIRP